MYDSNIRMQFTQPPKESRLQCVGLKARHRYRGMERHTFVAHSFQYHDFRRKCSAESSQRTCQEFWPTDLLTWFIMADKGKSPEAVRLVAVRWLLLKLKGSSGVVAQGEVAENLNWGVSL